MVDTDGIFSHQTRWHKSLFGPNQGWRLLERLTTSVWVSFILFVSLNEVFYDAPPLEQLILTETTTRGWWCKCNQVQNNFTNVKAEWRGGHTQEQYRSVIPHENALTDLPLQKVLTHLISSFSLCVLLYLFIKNVLFLFFFFFFSWHLYVTWCTCQPCGSDALV